MLDKEESSYQVDNKNLVQGQIIGEGNQVVQNFYGYDHQRILPTNHCQPTIQELERIGEAYTFKGDIYTRFSLIALVLLVLSVILWFAFRDASRLEKDAFITLSTDEKFESQSETLSNRRI